MKIGELTAKYGIDVSGIQRGNRKMKQSISMFKSQANKGKQYTNKLSRSLGSMNGNLLKGSRAMATLSSSAGVAAGVLGGSLAIVGSTVLAYKKLYNVSKSLNAELVKNGVEVEELSSRLDMSAESLQEFTYIARRFGVKNDAVVDGLKEMQMRADEFATTASGPAAEAFERLGISQETVENTKDNTEEMYNIITESFRDIEDSAARQRIADELFGGQAAEQMVEMLGASREEIEELGIKAEESGAIMSNELVAATKRQRDLSLDIKDSFSSLKNIMGEGVVVGFNKFNQGVSDMIEKNKEAFKTMSKDAGESVKRIGKWFNQVLAKDGGMVQWAIKRAKDAVKALRGLTITLFPTDEEKNIKNINKSIKKTELAIENVRDKISETRDELSNLDNKSGPKFNNLRESLEEARNYEEELVDKLNNLKENRGYLWESKVNVDVQYNEPDLSNIDFSKISKEFKDRINKSLENINLSGAISGGINISKNMTGIKKIYTVNTAIKELKDGFVELKKSMDLNKNTKYRDALEAITNKIINQNKEVSDATGQRKKLEQEELDRLENQRQKLIDYNNKIKEHKKILIEAKQEYESSIDSSIDLGGGDESGGENLNKKIQKIRDLLSGKDNDKEKEKDTLSLEERKNSLSEDAKKAMIVTENIKNQKNQLDELNKKLENQKEAEKKINDQLDERVKKYLIMKSYFEQSGIILDSFREGWDKYYETVKTNAELGRDIFAQSMQSMSNELTDFVMTGEMSFKNLFKSIERQLVQSKMDDLLEGLLEPVDVETQNTGGLLGKILHNKKAKNIQENYNINNNFSDEQVADSSRNFSLLNQSMTMSLSSLK